MPATLTLEQAAAVLKTTAETVDARRASELLTYDQITGIFTWRVTRTGRARAGSKAGRLSSAGYIQIQIDGRLYYAHRLAVLLMTGTWPPHQVDHVDGRRTNNAWSNLRLATVAENAQNRSAQRNSATQHIGVSYAASRCQYIAQIHRHGRRRTIGWFDTADEAFAAYKRAKAEIDAFQPAPRS